MTKSVHDVDYVRNIQAIGGIITDVEINLSTNNVIVNVFFIQSVTINTDTKIEHP